MAAHSFGLQATGLTEVDGAGRMVISDRAELFAAFADVNPLPWEDVAGWAIPLLEQAEGAHATARAGDFGWVLGIDEGLGNALLGLGETELAIGRAFQDLLRPATEEQQQQIAADLHDWWFDKTPRERADINLARIEQSGEWLRERFPDQLVEVVGGGAYAAARATDLWLQDLDRAYQAGDNATVAAMLTEPAASIGAGFLFEAAAAELILGRTASGATASGVGTMTAKKLSPRVHATAGYSARDGLPNGLRLSLPEGERLYGIPASTLDEALRMADATDTVIVVRGRSGSTLLKIERGANGKPPEVKVKSLKEADRHLYFPNAAREGVPPDEFIDWVPGVAPTRPDPDDFLGLPRAEYDEAVLRYHERLAEYERYRPELEHWMQNDFIYLENGKEVVTRLGIDEDGMLILTHNGRRLAGDNDLFHVFHEGGGEISQELYDNIFPWLEKDFDLKHGITLNRDFGAADEAERAVLDGVARGHMQSPPGGGEPGGALLLITGDGLVTGRIRNYTVNPNALPNHQTTATYIGLPGQTP